MGYLEIGIDGSVDMIMRQAGVLWHPLHKVGEFGRGEGRVERDFGKVLVPELRHRRQRLDALREAGRSSCFLLHHAVGSGVDEASVARHKQLDDTFHGFELGPENNAAAVFLLLAWQEDVVKACLLQLQSDPRLQLQPAQTNLYTLYYVWITSLD